MFRSAADPSEPAQVPGLLVRLAVMIYEAVLLFGVTFIVGYALLASLRWTYPLAAHQRWLLQAVLFVAIGAYFVSSWTRSGQTLAMKAWRLRLADRDGRRLSPRTAILRYLLAWTLFLPGLLFVALFPAAAGWDAVALAVGFIAMLSVGRLPPHRQLLHDRWLGTRVTCDRPR